MKSQRYLQLLDEMQKLHEAKSAGYSGKDNPDPWANFRLSRQFGISPSDGALVRMSDKWQRLTSLLKNPENDMVGESIKDTLMDLSAYALIVICLMEEESKL